MRRTNPKIAAAVFALVLGASLVPSASHAQQLPAQNQALLILRLLAYDRALPSRSGAEVSVAVIARDGAEADAAQAEIAQALSDLSNKTSVAGRKVRIVRIAFTSADKLDATLAQEHAVAAYVTAGLTDQLSTIIQVTRRRSVLTFSGVESHVQSGTSFAIVRRGPKSAILVNLPAAKAEGADLDSSLLRVAEVVKR